MQYVLQLASYVMVKLSTRHVIVLPGSLDDEVLHGLDQAALDVSRGTGLDSSVDQTLPTTHGVEEELLQTPLKQFTLHQSIKPAGELTLATDQR